MAIAPSLSSTGNFLADRLGEHGECSSVFSGRMARTQRSLVANFFMHVMTDSAHLKGKSATLIMYFVVSLPLADRSFFFQRLALGPVNSDDTGCTFVA